VRLDNAYKSRNPVTVGQNAELVDAGKALTRFWLVLGRDTVALDTVPLRTEREGNASAPSVTYTGSIAGHAVRLHYGFAPDTADSYLMHVGVKVDSAPLGASLIVGLPQSIRSNEPDTVDDLNHLAVSYRPARGDVQSIGFSKMDSTSILLEPGPINWVATRNKYFLVAFRAATTPFSTLHIQGAPRTGKIAQYSKVRAALPIGSDGTAAFDIYAGPQDFERLQRLGGDLDQVNPYAGWLHGVVQPFATIVMKALLWMKHTTQLNYGWVLVLFGVIIRLVLWPLNQGAMRTSMKMQRLQPELQALQKKYSDDPKRQQEAIMKVYKEHGMSPLSPLMGCLPMLLPMPVLFALYYVFQNTIEFRGVSFLWLPDISLRDPYYITPLLMGVSMFAMSWIGMRNSPPNPQAKMMSYMMPVMLTVLFLNFASGLNLYYAVQNIAAIPQQWLLARERAKNPGPAGGGASLEKQRA
jgi:YidC/Oxa1 family membrane protein insertase